MNADQTPVVLELKDVYQSYGQQKTLRGLSLSLNKGDIGCLLGPSGCGKTTVLRCIAGFETISQGEIWVNSVLVSNVYKNVPPEKRRIGMVFQDSALFPHLNVAGNIKFGLYKLSKTEQEQRCRELLEMMGLSNLASKFPHELSGGQQQRIALARALAPQPDLLLLDEPFSSLDVDLRARLALDVRRIIKELHATAIMVTHDQQEAFAIADKVGVLHEGEIQQWDSAYNLYHKPANRFIADFIGQGVFIRGKVIERDSLQTELGMMRGMICQDCSLGGEAEVLLRPDDVIHDDDSPLQVEVVHKAFRGAEFLYTLKLASGSEILALVPSHHNHAIGEKIGIRLDVDHVIAFSSMPLSARTS